VHFKKFRSGSKFCGWKMSKIFCVYLIHLELSDQNLSVFKFSFKRGRPCDKNILKMFYLYLFHEVVEKNFHLDPEHASHWGAWFAADFVCLDSRLMACGGKWATESDKKHFHFLKCRLFLKISCSTGKCSGIMRTSVMAALTDGHFWLQSQSFYSSRLPCILCFLSKILW